MLYAVIARLFLPAARWGRMSVTGAEEVPAHGPVLVVPNHDSQWDPVVAAVALRRRRKLRFLARANLWQIPGLGRILTAIGQIPIECGVADEHAMASATEALSCGEAVCVFPEGKLSLGRALPARSGVGRLALTCPEATIVLCAITGTTDFVRFPRRPRVAVSFYPSRAGQERDGQLPREQGPLAWRNSKTKRASRSQSPASGASCAPVGLGSRCSKGVTHVRFLSEVASPLATWMTFCMTYMHKVNQVPGGVAECSHFAPAVTVQRRV